MMNPSWKETIDRNAMFAAFPEALRQTTLSKLVSRKLKDGETLYRRGDESEGLYGVLTGRVRFSAESVEGKSIVLNYLEAGEWFGEIGLLDGGPRIVDAQAMGDSEFLLLRRRDFLAVCDAEPSLMRHIIDLLCRRLRLAGQLIEDAAFLDLSCRLARRLLDLADSVGKPVANGILVDIHLPQEELGRLVGATREAVGRQLRHWENRGWIDLKYGKITIIQTQALQTMIKGLGGL